MGIHVTGVTDAPLYRMHQIVLPWRGVVRLWLDSSKSQVLMAAYHG